MEAKELAKKIFPVQAKKQQNVRGHLPFLLAAARRRRKRGIKKRRRPCNAVCAKKRNAQKLSQCHDTQVPEQRSRR